MVTKKKTTKKSTKKVKKITNKTTRKRIQEKKQATPKQQNSMLLSSIYLLVGLVIVITVLAALIYVPQYQQQKEQSKYMYNNFEFVQEENGQWFVRIVVNEQPFAVLLDYHPLELEHIPVDPNATELVQAMASKHAASGNGKVYISLDPEAPGTLAVAGVELAKVLGERFGIFNIPTQAAFSKPIAAVGDSVPVRTCKDASQDELVLWIRTADTNQVGIPQDYPYCVVLQAVDANTTIEVVDRFIYDLFGVMNDS